MTYDHCHVCERDNVPGDWYWHEPGNHAALRVRMPRGRWVFMCHRCQDQQQLPVLARYGG